MSTTTSPDIDRPIVKFRWLKRIAWAVLVLLIVLCCVRWWWGIYANRQLQAEIDRIRATGEPILLEDFQYPPIDDADNAAIPLAEAAQIAKSLGDELDEVDDDRFFEAYGRIKPLIRQVRSRSHCDSEVPLESPLLSRSLGDLSYLRVLTRCLSEAANRQHRFGDDAAAIATTVDILAVRRKAKPRPNFLIHWLIGSISYYLATDTIERISPGLRIAGTDAADNRDVRPVSRERLQELIDELLADEFWTDDCVTALISERLFWLDTTQCVADGRLSYDQLLLVVPRPPGAWGQVTAFFVKPAVILDSVRGLRQITSMIRAAEAPLRPEAKALSGESERGSFIGHRFTRRLSRTLVEHLPRTVGGRSRAVAKSRMAAVALAMRLYEVDNGRHPAKLEELVPDYLSEIPADPYATDGRAIGYQPEATRVAPPGEWFQWNSTPAMKRPRPVLYSVGPDGRDDNGTGGSGLHGDSRGDMVFHLSVYQPAPKAEPLLRRLPPGAAGGLRQARDNDDGVADDQGDADEDQRGE